jgi:hypothetical protein
MFSKDDPAHALTLQFLAWVAESPRTYADVMETWRTSCPRLQVWEEATANGLVRREKGPSLREAKIVITAEGRQCLAQQLLERTGIERTGSAHQGGAREQQRQGRQH